MSFNRGLSSLLAVALLASFALAEPPLAVITDPGPVQPGDFLILDGSGSERAVQYHWRLTTKQPSLAGIDNKQIATGTRHGRFVAVLVVVSESGEFDVATIEVDPKEPTPTPPNPPPVPPNPPPNPPPVPPNPGPGKMRVAIIEETEDRGKLTPGQTIALMSPTIRDYLDSHCEKDASGQPMWRILDEDADAAKSPEWAAVLSRPRTELPWIVISSGGAGVEQPLPKTEVEIIALLQSWGGP